MVSYQIFHTQRSLLPCKCKTTKLALGLAHALTSLIHYTPNMIKTMDEHTQAYTHTLDMMHLITDDLGANSYVITEKKGR